MSVSRILSALSPIAIGGRGGNHLSKRPTRECIPPNYRGNDAGNVDSSLIWSCSRWGLPCLRQSPVGAVSSYLTFSPLPREINRSYLLLNDAKYVISRGGLFSVALSVPDQLETSVFTEHPALWSSDFPPRFISR